MIRCLVAAVVGGLLLGPCAWADPVVKLVPGTDSVAVTIDGQEFTTLRTARSQPKPYFFPVRAADGISIVRPLEKPEDHPHHKGAWCSIDEVNGIKFWAEKGKIENVKLEILAAEGSPARLRITNHWLGDDGQPVLVETATVSVFANRLMIYDLQFTAGKNPVTFGDTKEGMFGIRVADTLRGKQGGRIQNAEGKKGEKECWGQLSKWVDYVGSVEGKTKGVTLFDHPRNFRASRFHVRDYGLFTLSPFGQSAYTNGTLPADPYNLPAGQSARLRYGLFVHDGETDPAAISQVYEQFLKGTE
ncbi:MAG TPA: hypothetical protein DDY91_01165 [Planctomycetaceae bacterium]|jgi:hypothetical protein|nr:hypothetical protein [Planctomycetaceae bacterium]